MKSPEENLAREVRILTKEITKLKKLEFFEVFKHPLKFIWFSFLKGLMVGFGSVLGATVILAAFIFLISKISFVPIVGDFAQQVINEINGEQGPQQITPTEAPSVTDSLPQ